MQFYHRILGLFKAKRMTPQQALEKRLNPAVLAQIKAEAALLQGAHAVKVEELAEGEEAGMPKAVDAAFEASLPRLQVIVPQAPYSPDKAS